MDIAVYSRLSNSMHSDNRDSTIRVMLIESRQAMREGLRQMLEDETGIEVIAEVPDTHTAISQMKTLTPDSIIVDIEPEVGHIPEKVERLKRLIRPLKKAAEQASIIVLSDNHELLAPAIATGISGYLTKSVSRDELAAAVRITNLWRLVLFSDQRSFTLVKI